MKKLLFLGLIFIFCLSLASNVIAQDDDLTAETATEEMTVEDLGLSEPTVLPTNTFLYFFKNLGRSLQEIFTFDVEAKTELQLEHATERLAEIEKMVEEGSDDPRVQTLIEKNQEKYEQIIEKVYSKLEQIKESGDEEVVDRILDKVADRELKVQRFFNVIAEKARNLSEEQAQKMMQVKERTLEKFGQTLEKVEDKTKLQSRLENAIKNQTGKNLSEDDDLEILEYLEHSVSDSEIKESLERVKEKQRKKDQLHKIDLDIDELDD